MAWLRSLGASSAIVLASLLASGVALAQGPSPEQVAEIRRECRADYIRHCSSVPPGGEPAFACLRNNDARLSNGCRLAVEAVGAHAPGSVPPLGATSAPAASSGGEPLREACAADFGKYCRSVVAGGGRALGCLLDHHASLTESCRTALEAGRQRLRR